MRPRLVWMHAAAILIGFAGAVSHSAKAPPLLSVFSPGEGGYAAFRIPGVIVGANGTVHAFAEGRRFGCADFAGQHDVVYKRSTNGGVSFSRLVTLLDPYDGMFGEQQCPHELAADINGNCAFWDPTAVVAANGDLILFAQRSWAHRIGRGGRAVENVTRNTSEPDVVSSKDARLEGLMDCWMLRSTDDGISWGAPRNVTSEVWSDTWRMASTSNGHGLLVRGLGSAASGRLFMPVYVHPTEQFVAHPDLAMRSAIWYSDDGGHSWHFPNSSLVGEGTSESELVVLPPANHSTVPTLLFNHRRNDLCPSDPSRPCPFTPTTPTRYESRSTDGGMTFHGFAPITALPDPACKGGVINWPSVQSPAGVMLVNDASATQRADVTLRYSPDGGRSWTWQVLVSELGGYADVARLPASRERPLPRALVLFEAPQCGPIKLAIIDPA